MANDLDGKLYTRLIENFALHAPAITSPLMKALHFLVSDIAGALSTESTVAVGYANKNLYVARLGRATPPVEDVERIKSILAAPLDGVAEDIMSALDDTGPYPVEHVLGVGGGKTGLHAEMMIIKSLRPMDAWGANFFYGVGIAASQGACPACAGFLNLKNIWHTGVRSTGKVSSRWINPIDDTVCGSEVGLGLSFPNRNVEAGYQWKKDL